MILTKPFRFLDYHVGKAMAHVMLFYSNYITLLLAPRCRFYPSCSRYAHEAVLLHGAVKGSALAARRLLKCHPWHHGGFDYVPGSPRAIKSESCSCQTPNKEES